MASKILADNRAGQSRPFAWRSVSETGETVDRRRTALEAGSTGLTTASRPDGVHPLERRIAEIEAAFVEREQAAREAGFREGEAAGKAQAESEVRIAIGRLSQSILEMDQFHARLLRQSEADAVRLSIAIARRVLRREVTLDPAAIEGLVRAALEKLQSQERCRVRMHPNYVPVLRSEIDRLGMSAKVEVIVDPAQEPGAAVFEMARGNLDASIDTQLREIERGLVDRLQRA
jgi:flagellar assembly protein FliH